MKNLSDHKYIEISFFLVSMFIYIIYIQNLATVITNLLSAVPVFGQDLVESNYATELSSCLGILPSPASCARRAKPNLPSPALEAATLPLPAKQAGRRRRVALGSKAGERVGQWEQFTFISNNRNSQYTCIKQRKKNKIR